MNTIAISKNQIKEEGGVVVLSIKEYQKMQASMVPSYYLHGKEAGDLDNLVKNGLKSYKNGKTKIIKSLADLD
jgi:hypothetical protein